MNKKLEEDLVGYLLQACATLRNLTDRLTSKSCSLWVLAPLELLDTYLGKLAESVRKAVRKDRKTLHKTIELACAHLLQSRENLEAIKNDLQ